MVNGIPPEVQGVLDGVEKCQKIILDMVAKECPGEHPMRMLRADPRFAMMKVQYDSFTDMAVEAVAMAVPLPLEVNVG